MIRSAVLSSGSDVGREVRFGVSRDRPLPFRQNVPGGRMMTTKARNAKRALNVTMFGHGARRARRHQEIQCYFGL